MGESLSRLAIVLVTPQLSIGGAEVHVVQLATHLRRRGHAVTVVSAGGPLAAQLGDADAGHVLAPADSKRPPGILRTTAIVRRLLAKASGPVVLHAHAAIPSLSCWLASRGRRNTCVVSTGHGWDKQEYRRVAHVLRFTSRRVIAVSGEMAESLVRSGLGRDSVSVIPNSVDVERFAAVPRSAREQVRGEWGIPPDACLLGVVGRLEEQKGHHALLAAAALRNLPALRIVIVGDGLLRVAIEEESRHLGLAERTVFAGARSDVPAVMAALDLLVLPSLWEGLPMVALEGMAAGLPVVATAVGGIPEAVVDGETGVLVPAGNVEALADALASLAHDPWRRRQMGQAGQQRARALYDIERMIERVEGVYAAALRTA